MFNYCFAKIVTFRIVWKNAVEEDRPRMAIVHGAFKFYGILIFFSGMEADRNVKVVGGDVAVL